MKFITWSPLPLSPTPNTNPRHSQESRANHFHTVPEVFLSTFPVSEEHFYGELPTLSLELKASRVRVGFSLAGPFPNAFRVKAYHSNVVVDASAFGSPSAFQGTGLQSEPLLPAGDGLFFVWDNRVPLHPKTLIGPQLAINTADCLAVAMAATLGHRTYCALVHAGWRGYTTGIHFNALESMRKSAEQDGHSIAQLAEALEVFISPAIFGVSYECGRDVAVAIASHVHERLSPLPAFPSLLPIHSACCDTRSSLGLQTPGTHKIHPDLQLMMACDLVAWGFHPQSIQIFRENTFGHSVLPSFREATLTGADTRQRLTTHLCLPPFQGG